MKDPDANDTEPTGCAFASAEDTDPHGDAAAASRDAPFAEPPEHDTDDFLRWLPTMSLGHRRRTELVERPSSDGADFAAYASSGRPAAASVRPRPEVRVPPPSLARLSEGDAPTVLSRRKRASRRRRAFAWLSGGLVVACAALEGWTHRAEPRSSGDQTVSTHPPPPAPPAPPTLVASRALPPRAVPQTIAQAPGANALAPPGVPRSGRAAPSPSPAQVHKREAVSVHAAIDPVATSRPPPVAAASAPAAKDQYFETP